MFSLKLLERQIPISIALEDSIILTKYLSIYPKSKFLSNQGLYLLREWSSQDQHQNMSWRMSALSYWRKFTPKQGNEPSHSMKESIILKYKRHISITCDNFYPTSLLHDCYLSCCRCCKVSLPIEDKCTRFPIF